MREALLEAMKRRHPAHVEILDKLLPVLEAGEPTPFLVRYRRDMLCGLDPVVFEKLKEGYRDERDLERRRQGVLKALEGEENVPEALLAKVGTSTDRAFLEDVMRPLRRRKKGGDATPDPMAPVAEAVLSAEAGGPSLDEMLAPFCGADGAPPTVDDQTKRLVRLVAERLAADPMRRAAARAVVRRNGIVKSSAAKGKTLKDSYGPVKQLEQPLTRLKPRTLLLLRRGQKAGVLDVKVELPADRREALLAEQFQPAPEHPHADLVREAGVVALDELVLPRVGGEAILDRRRGAERSLLPGIARSLRERFLAPPAGAVPVLAVIPGATGACRLLVVDAQGRPGATEAVHPLPPRGEAEAAAARLTALLAESGAQLVAVAGSRRARAVRDWVRETLAKAEGVDATPVTVHEAAAVHLADAADAAEELPSSVRAALSLGRYVQDPLKELVRYDLTRVPLDPSQRDLDQGELRRTVDDVAEECVARVGVDVNTADVSLLSRVPGFSEPVARTIVTHRSAQGPFGCLADVRALEGVPEDAYQRAGGFLRAVGSSEPLDETGVHPTGTPLASAIAESLETTAVELIGAADKLKGVDQAQFVTEAHTPSDVLSVVTELGRGKGDPRGPFLPPAFNAGLHSLKQLEEGMELSGVVRTISKFGAFVDVGLRQEGLVHVSQLSHEFVQDPSEVVAVGDKVRVKVIGVDPGKRRISLSIKQLLPAPERSEQDDRRGGGRRGGGGPRGRGDGPGGRRGDRKGGRGGGRRGDRGGPRERRSRAPAPRAMPKDGDPFHMQLNALRAQLGMAAPKPKKKPKPKKAKARTKPKPASDAKPAKDDKPKSEDTPPTETPAAAAPIPAPEPAAVESAAPAPTSESAPAEAAPAAETSAPEPSTSPAAETPAPAAEAAPEQPAEPTADASSNDHRPTGA